MPAYVIFMARADVPDDVAAKLEAAILAATKDDAFKTIVQDRLKAPVLSVNSTDLSAYMNDLHGSFKTMVGN